MYFIYLFWSFWSIQYKSINAYHRLLTQAIEIMILFDQTVWWRIYRQLIGEIPHEITKFTLMTKKYENIKYIKKHLTCLCLFRTHGREPSSQNFYTVQLPPLTLIGGNHGHPGVDRGSRGLKNSWSDEHISKTYNCKIVVWIVFRHLFLFPTSIRRGWTHQRTLEGVKIWSLSKFW